MIKYIILDVDRTLVDSFKPELLSFQEAIENVVGYKITDEQAQKFTVMPTLSFLKYLNLTDEQIKRVMKEWEITFSKYKTKCFDGIKDVIKELSKKGYIFGLITSRTLDEYHELDSELSDINDLFKVVVTSDKVNNPKPHIDSMNYLCKELNCSTDEVLYIGDSLLDKVFAENSKCLFIPACYDNKELSNEVNACFNPKELTSIVEKIKSTNN